MNSGKEDGELEFVAWENEGGFTTPSDSHKEEKEKKLDKVEIPDESEMESNDLLEDTQEFDDPPGGEA